METKEAIGILVARAKEGPEGDPVAEAIKTILHEYKTVVKEADRIVHMVNELTSAASGGPAPSEAPEGLFETNPATPRRDPAEAFRA